MTTFLFVVKMKKFTKVFFSKKKKRIEENRVKYGLREIFFISGKME